MAAVLALVAVMGYCSLSSTNQITGENVSQFKHV